MYHRGRSIDADLTLTGSLVARGMAVEKPPTDQNHPVSPFRRPKGLYYKHLLPSSSHGTVILMLHAYDVSLNLTAVFNITPFWA